MDTQELTFIEKLFQETILLLHETRDYIEWQAPHDLNSFSTEDSMFLSCEVSRTTARLTEIMAWLLAQSARKLGQITEHRLLKTKPCLSGDENCIIDSTLSCPVTLPIRLLELLDKTRNLYLRILRLEENKFESGV